MIDGIRVEFEGGRAVKIDADKGADALRGDRGEGRRLVTPRGARARRRRGAHRPARHDVLRDAARRERGEPHRARQRLRPRRRGGRGQGADQHERHPRRLHDRLARARRRRPHGRRRRSAALARRRLAGVTPDAAAAPSAWQRMRASFPRPQSFRSWTIDANDGIIGTSGILEGFAGAGRVALGPRHRSERGDDHRRSRPRRRNLGGGRSRARCATRAGGGGTRAARSRSRRGDRRAHGVLRAQGPRAVASTGGRRAADPPRRARGATRVGARHRGGHAADPAGRRGSDVRDRLRARRRGPARDHARRLRRRRVLGDPRRGGRLADAERRCGPEGDAFRDLPRPPGGDPSGGIPLGGIPLANKHQTGGSGSYWM